MYAFIDFKTTGVNPILDEVCEISIVTYNKNFNIKTEFKSLLNTYCKYPEDMLVVNGISESDILDMPYFDEIIPQISMLITGKIICGYNVRDYILPFISEQYMKADYEFDLTEFKTIDISIIENHFINNDFSSLCTKYTDKRSSNILTSYERCLASKEILLNQAAKFNLDLNLGDMNSMLGIETPFVDPMKKLVYIDGQVCWGFGRNKLRPVTTDIVYANWSLKSELSKSTKYYIKKELEKINK